MTTIAIIIYLLGALVLGVSAGLVIWGGIGEKIAGIILAFIGAYGIGSALVATGIWA